LPLLGFSNFPSHSYVYSAGSALSFKAKTVHKSTPPSASLPGGSSGRVAPLRRPPVGYSSARGFFDGQTAGLQETQASIPYARSGHTPPATVKGRLRRLASGIHRRKSVFRKRRVLGFGVKEIKKNQPTRAEVGAVALGNTVAGEQALAVFCECGSTAKTSDSA
jgi:hypothetical protein